MKFLLYIFLSCLQMWHRVYRVPGFLSTFQSSELGLTPQASVAPSSIVCGRGTNSNNGTDTLVLYEMWYATPVFYGQGNSVN
jgi:hypothetical protein